MKSQLETRPEITDEMKKQAEKELREKKKPVDYNTIDYPVEILYQKYKEGLDKDSNELFIPDYQREFVWDEDKQSKFIESVLLDLPIPPIFVADISSKEKDLARLEIIDGTQRIRTLHRFLNNELKLKNLETLESFNGFTFSDLPFARQRRFKGTTLRVIKLTEDADEGIRRNIFKRINTGGLQLTPMEERIGIYNGDFFNLTKQLSEHELFHSLCAFSRTAIATHEPQEFVLRFFTFLNNYENFLAGDITNFLNNYLKEQDKKATPSELNDMENEFIAMLHFVNQYFPHGFQQNNKTTTRIKFESLAIGVALALRKNKNLKPKSTDFLNSEQFKEYTTSDANSSQKKVKQRIEYVRDQILGEDYEG